MLQHKGNKFDPLGNILYGSTEKEEFTHFTYNANQLYPIRVESIGITHPDKDYFIERKHADYYILEYVKSGKGHIVCDGNEYTVTQGCVYLIHPGMKHKYYSDKKEPYEKIWINFLSGVFTDILSAYGLAKTVYFEDSDCEEYFNKLITLAENYTDNGQIYLEVSEIIFQIILKLVKNTNQKKVSTIANLLKETLDRSIYSKITIENIAEDMNISKSQLCREFKKYYDLSPYQYLINRRLSIAETLLLETTVSIREISDLLCFVDAYSFSNLFKKKLGVSPKKYRENKIKYLGVL